MLKILYLSTNNMCRSILAEAITRKTGANKVKVMSGGSNPGDDMHPVAYRVLRDNQYSPANLVSKSWDKAEIWRPDIVITLCDKVLKEKCPTYVGKSIHVHWGMSDPVNKIGNMEQNITEAFEILEIRIKRMLEEDMEQMDKSELREHLKRVIK